MNDVARAALTVLCRLSRVSVVETVLVYAVIPLVIYGVIAMLTLRDKVAKNPRYRPGQAWDYPEVWWTANPAGADAVPAVTGSASKKTAKGGARGSW
jgi:hypothetical protein